MVIIDDAADDDDDDHLVYARICLPKSYAAIAVIVVKCYYINEML